jgi:hypothetical protein
MDQIDIISIMERLFDTGNSILRRDPREFQEFPEPVQRELSIIEEHLNALFSELRKAAPGLA